MDKPTYSDEDLARIREDELTPREYNGKEYTRFSKAMGLREQRERVMIDGLGNVGAGKFVVEQTYHARDNFPKGYVERRNVGSPISVEQLELFVSKVKYLDLKLAVSEGKYGDLIGTAVRYQFFMMRLSV